MTQRIKTVRRLADVKPAIMGRWPTYDAVLYKSKATTALTENFSYRTDFYDDGYALAACYSPTTNYLSPIFRFHEGALFGKEMRLDVQLRLGPSFVRAADITKRMFPDERFRLYYGNKQDSISKEHCDSAYKWVATFTLGRGRPRTEWPTEDGFESGPEGSAIICNGKFRHRSPPYPQHKRAIISTLGLLPDTPLISRC